MTIVVTIIKINEHTLHYFELHIPDLNDIVRELDDGVLNLYKRLSIGHITKFYDSL